jgi:purine nucleosidase
VRLIVDTDPGIDDGVALTIALRAPGVTVEAITVVHGNVALERGVRNARLIVETCLADVPVVAGAAKPLVRPFVSRPAWVHGHDGFGDLGLAPEHADADAGFAPDRIVDLIMRAPGEITLVTLGPLTNVALAIAREPRVAEAAREMVMLGGAASATGNVTPVAEFNVHADPEAAKAVFAAGFRLTMVGIELCRGPARLSDADVRAITALRTPVARLVGALLGHSLSVASRRPMLPSEQGATCPDAVAIAGALDRSILTDAADCYVDVETSGVLTTGMTVVDRLGVLDRPANARIGLGVDATRFKQLLVDRCR